MLLQIFVACPAPAAPQCTIFLPIFSSTGLARREGLGVAAAHEGKRCTLGAGGAAGDRRVDRKGAVLGRQRMGLLGAFDIDGRAIDDQRALCHRGNDLVPHRQHMLAGATMPKLARVLGRYASNPDLSFSWYDAAVLSQKIRIAAAAAVVPDPFATF